MLHINTCYIIVTWFVNIVKHGDKIAITSNKYYGAKAPMRKINLWRHITRPYFLQFVDILKKRHTCIWRNNSSHAYSARWTGNFCPGAKCRCDRTLSFSRIWRVSRDYLNSMTIGIIFCDDGEHNVIFS